MTCSNFQAVVAKIKTRGEVLRRNILTSMTAQTLSGADVDQRGLVELLTAAGVGLIGQEVATLFHTLDPLKTGAIKVSKLLKLVA